jgi:Ca2+-binding EF-hand superfamily protein
MTMRIWIAGVITIFLLTGVAFAAATDFGGLDRDGSGYLDESEIRDAAPEVLKTFDRNGDGVLDRSEFETAGGSPSRFEFMDKDKNGRIDIDEFRSAASERFKQIDTDRNGRIDVQEWNRLQRPIQNPILFFYF